MTLCVQQAGEGSLADVYETILLSQLPSLLFLGVHATSVTHLQPQSTLARGVQVFAKRKPSLLRFELLFALIRTKMHF